ncbi:GNAT family N-acetyltransferase [Paenibacillus sp. GCM10027629]|uniref:GNAT family N-acetyltransferase n=1 Tax=Paenibacillus sp. GCM10027629 TaxID=3273414 RepID=UPI0036257A29
MITFQAIDKANWQECINLKLKKEQEQFIASNLYSIAQVQFLERFEAKAIYDEQQMVGFTLFGLDSDDDNYWIYRFMIDERFQGRGYGTAAFNSIIDHIRQREDRTDVLMISYAPTNEQARRLYAKAGFTELGIMPWSNGEVVAKYTF